MTQPRWSLVWVKVTHTHTHTHTQNNFKLANALSRPHSMALKPEYINTVELVQGKK